MLLPRRSSVSIAACLLALAIIPALLFWCTFSFPLSFEDYEVNFVLNRFDLRAIMHQFAQPVTAFLIYYRPMGDFLAWLMLRLAGPWYMGQHLLSYLMLWLTACGLYFLVRQLTGNTLASFTIALLYSVAPVQANYFLVSSTYAFDRGVALFVVWCLALATTRIWPLCPLLTYFALSSKDNALVLPGLFVLLIGAYYIRFRQNPEADKNGVLQKIRLAAVTSFVVFVGFLAFKIYSATVLKKGGLPVSSQVNPQIVLDLRPETFLRNLRIHLLYHLEMFTWWRLPEKSLDTWLRGVPSASLLAIPALYLGLFIIEIVWLVRSRGKRGTLFPVGLHVGAWWAAICTLPMSLFREQYRVTYYMALLPAAGVAISIGTALNWVFKAISRRFRFHRSLQILGILYSAIWLLLVANTWLWLPHAITAKTYYRTQLEMGTRLLENSVQQARELGVPERYKEVLLRGFSDAELFVLYPIRSYPLFLGVAPHTFEPVSADSELFRYDVNGNPLVGIGPNTLVLNRLTDRTAALTVLASGLIPVDLAVPLLNGDFSEATPFLRSKRPLYWVPYPMSPCPDFRLSSSTNRRMIKMDDLPAQMAAGVQQRCLLQQGREYNLRFTSRSNKAGTIPAVEIMEAGIPLFVQRELGRSAEEMSMNVVVPRTDAYDIRFGNAGSTTGDLELLDIKLVESAAGPFEESHLSPSAKKEVRLPIPEKWLSTRSVIDALTSQPVTQLYDESTTSDQGWPVFTMDRAQPTAYQEQMELTLVGRAAESNFVDVKVITFGRDASNLVAPRASFVLTFPFGDEWTTRTQRFSYSQADERVRLDFTPCSGAHPEQSTGSVLLRAFSLGSIAEIPATGAVPR